MSHQSAIFTICLLLSGCQWVSQINQHKQLNKAETAEVIRPFTNRLNTRISALTTIAKLNITVVEQPDEYHFMLLSDHFFEINSDNLLFKRHEGLDRLIFYLKTLDDNDDNPIVISGHTDRVGSRQHRESLSMRQAERIKTYFWNRGIEQRQMSAQGLGGDQPISKNNEHLNRRIVIQIKKAY